MDAKTLIENLPIVTVRKGSRMWLYTDDKNNWRLVSSDDVGLTIRNHKGGDVRVDDPDEVNVMVTDHRGRVTFERMQFGKPALVPPPIPKLVAT